MFWCLPRSLLRCLGVYPKMSWCVKMPRNASIYRSLGVGEWHVAESNWWHMSQFDLRIFKIFLQDTWHRLNGRIVLIFKVTHVSNWLDRLYHHLRGLTVIAYTCWCVACVIAYMCILHFYVFISWHLANFCWFLNGDGRN